MQRGAERLGSILLEDLVSDGEEGSKDSMVGVRAVG